MAIVNTLEMYEALRREFADAPSKAITGVIERSLENYEEKQKNFLVTKGEFKETIANLRAELIKWMFIFWVGQVSVMLGVFVAFVKK